MSLPKIVLTEGVAWKETINVVKYPTGFDLTDYDDVKISCADLAISKTTAGGISSVAATSFILEIDAADSTGEEIKSYRYQLYLQTGGKWYSVYGAEGTIEIQEAA